MTTQSADDSTGYDDNPGGRPKKYASAAERQAAYRARAVEVSFRADPGTVETLGRIAETIDVPRTDLLLSMTKFALANHDWARFGLTHKTLPKYQGNPIMATAAQIAARKRFAEMARSGAFAKTRKPARNPVAAKTRDFSENWAVHLASNDPQSWHALRASKAAATRLANLLTKQTGRKYTASPVTWAGSKRAENPAPAKRAPKRDFYYIVKVGSHYDGQFSSAHYTLAQVQAIAQAKADKYGVQARITEIHS